MEEFILKIPFLGVYSGGNADCSDIYSLFIVLSSPVQAFISDQVNSNINLELSDLLLHVEQNIGDILAGNVADLTANIQDESILGSFANSGEPTALCIVQFILGV